MKAINTYTPDEYANELANGLKRMRQALLRLIDEESGKSTDADHKGDEAKAVKHEFNARALRVAYNAMFLTPDNIKERLLCISIPARENHSGVTPPPGTIK